MEGAPGLPMELLEATLRRPLEVERCRVASPPHRQDLAKLGHGGRHPGRQILGLHQVENESRGLEEGKVFTGQGYTKGVPVVRSPLE